MSPQSLLANLVHFPILGLLLLLLFLPVYFSSRILLYTLSKWNRTKWHRLVAVTIICLCWMRLFGLPFAGPGYFDFDFLAIINQYLKKWSAHYGLLHGFKVQMLWIQIYFWLIPAWAFFRFLTRNAPKLQPQLGKYLSSEGYLVLSKENEFEHRYIAKQILGRDLERNEIVHHINGSKTDNRIGNLCVMDGEKHEHFHSWLRWKKDKWGRYPSINDQKRVLEKEYGGTLLESLGTLKHIKI